MVSRLAGAGRSGRVHPCRRDGGGEGRRAGSAGVCGVRLVFPAARHSTVFRTVLYRGRGTRSRRSRGGHQPRPVDPGFRWSGRRNRASDHDQRTPVRRHRRGSRDLHGNGAARSGFLGATVGAAAREPRPRPAPRSRCRLAARRRPPGAGRPAASDAGRAIDGRVTCRRRRVGGTPSSRSGRGAWRRSSMPDPSCAQSSGWCWRLWGSC